MERQTQHIMLQVSSLILVGEQELEVEGSHDIYSVIAANHFENACGQLQWPAF